MDSWIFKVARKVCIAVFASDIFIHAVVGASSVNGVVKGTLSMVVMLVMLAVLSRCDLKHKVKESRKERQKLIKKEEQNNEQSI